MEWKFLYKSNLFKYGLGIRFILDTFLLLFYPITYFHC